jgi:hypothetical protein
VIRAKSQRREAGARRHPADEGDPAWVAGKAGRRDRAATLAPGLERAGQSEVAGGLCCERRHSAPPNNAVILLPTLGRALFDGSTAMFKKVCLAVLFAVLFAKPASAYIQYTFSEAAISSYNLSGGDSDDSDDDDWPLF